MSYPYFDYFTIILYFVVGTICMLSVKIAKGGYNFNPSKSTKGLNLLFWTLLLFASLRKVGLHLGGEDALRYQEGFLDYFNHGSERYENTDILFGYFTGFIRLVTDNPIIYRMCCYGLISYGYVSFIKYISPQGICSIPFVCILIPYMRSFGSMRNTMSIALFLLCIVALFKKKYVICLLLACCSVLMHRLSFIMLSFFPFCYLFKDFILKSSKRKIIVFTLSFLAISYLLSSQLQKYVLLFSLFEDNGNADMWYLTNKVGNNILLNWPMYIVHVLLFIALILKYDSIPVNSNTNILKIIFIFDIIMLPATLVLGMWRFAEYFYISNLILWGVLINVYCQNFTLSSQHIIKACSLVGFYGLLYIRLSREWSDLAIMPYLFLWN